MRQQPVPALSPRAALPERCLRAGDARHQHACEQQDQLGSCLTSYVHHLTALHTHGLTAARDPTSSELLERVP